MKLEVLTRPFVLVMPGLVPGIHDFSVRRASRGWGRTRSGHDEWGCSLPVLFPMRREWLLGGARHAGNPSAHAHGDQLLGRGRVDADGAVEIGLGRPAAQGNREALH